MPPDMLAVASGISLTASLFALVYLFIANVVTIGFARSAAVGNVPSHWPSVSVLKPVSGLETGLYESLSSFCDQDYADFEVIFCVHDASDPAADVVKRVISAFPRCRASIAAGDNPLHRNPKIANISTAATAARGDLIIVADSDIFVEPSYLKAIAASFSDERVGAVTCLYRGIVNASYPSRLGAAAIEEQFAPSVLVAATLGRLDFCLGATMAVRRSVLNEIGGIDALGPFLADDHKLGRLISAAGHRVEMSRYVVATTVPETTLSTLWAHELRWARTNLILAPAGYTFSFLMHAVPLALLYLAISHNLALGLPVLCAAIALRTALHYAARAALGATRSGGLWLIPVRDLLSLAVWATSFFGRSVRWRNAQVAVAADGQLT